MGISYDKIMLILSFLVGVPIQSIKHGEDVPGYRDFHIKLQEITSIIAEQLIPVLEDNKWLLLIERLIGKEPALSYAIKTIAAQHIVNQLVLINSCYCSLGGREQLVAIWDFHLPQQWIEIIKQNMQDIKFEVFQWPRWFLSLTHLFFGFFLLPRLLLILLCSLMKNGVSCKKIEKNKFKIITEFVDPGRLNNTPQDVDCWVDGEIINKTDIFFFLTRDQKKRLKDIGYDIKWILNNVRDKGYAIKDLDEIPFPLDVIKVFIGLAIMLFKNIINVENVLLGKVFIKAWAEFLNFYPLFVHYRADNFIYLTFPNGRTDIRSNSGIITGFCRKFGIRSVGCQTRAIHSRNYQYFFDCFDLYLAWGRVWYEMLGEGMRFIVRVVIVGCIYINQPFLPVLASSHKKRVKSYTTPRLNVCIFPSDINLNSKHHYTLHYALTFIKNCARLAITHRNISFVIKSKTMEDAKIVLADKPFMKLFLQTMDNFKFIDRSRRHEYLDLLLSSDIIIAIGFTTPGLEGLLLGKRVIYYNELKCGGQAYSKIPDLIAGNYSELEDLLAKAIDDYNVYSNDISQALDRLDPFRDSQAIVRIRKILGGVPQCSY